VLADIKVCLTVTGRNVASKLMKLYCYVIPMHEIVMFVILCVVNMLCIHGRTEDAPTVQDGLRYSS
jgi:hypothetical protein